MEDEQILDLYWDRNPDAILHTDEKYGAYCRQISLHILRSREDAEECVNDGWLRAWDSIPPKKPERLGAYLAKVVRRLALNRLEKRNAGKRGGGELPLVLDELQTIMDDRKSFDQIVYRLSEGQGRTRASRSGGLRRVPRWSLAVLTSGERPVTGCLSGGGAYVHIHYIL